MYWFYLLELIGLHNLSELFAKWMIHIYTYILNYIQICSYTITFDLSISIKLHKL